VLLARLSPYGSLIHYSTPVYPGDVSRVCRYTPRSRLARHSAARNAALVEAQGLVCPKRLKAKEKKFKKVVDRAGVVRDGPVILSKTRGNSVASCLPVIRPEWGATILSLFPEEQCP
jgi:hypothetical protein